MPDPMLIGLVVGGSGLSGVAAYLFGKRRPIPGSAPDTVSTNLRHYHSRWHKDSETGIYACSDCGDRYLDGKPK